MTVHAGKDGVADMLDGDVHVFYETGVITKLCDKLVGNLIGIAIEQTNPRDFGRRTNFTHELGKRILAVDVKTVAAGILGDKVKLLHADTLKLLCLVDDVLNCTGAEAAADERNCTVGAKVVAALRYLKICGVGCGGEYSAATEGGGILVAEGCVGFATHNGVAGIGNILKAADTDHRLNLGHFTHYLITVTLNEAAGGDDVLALAVIFKVGGVDDVVNRLLLRTFDKAAGVDYNYLRLLNLEGNLVPSFMENIKHNLGIHKIFRAAEGYKCYLCHFHL